MTKKLIVISFFVIVFGLPVGWYLTLQFFGENKFDLPVLEQIDLDCLDVPNKAYLVIDSLDFDANRTEWKRIKKRLKSIEQSSIQVVNNTKCRRAKVFFVDEFAQLRGIYNISREDTDRMITEIDIYLHNFNNSSN